MNILLRSRKRPHPAAGFTLAENMVIVVMIGIMAAFAIPSYLSWVNNRRIDEATAIIEGAIREAQSEAIKKSRQCEVTFNNNRISANPVGCLVTGARTLRTEGTPIQMVRTDDTIRFSYRGTTSFPGRSTSTNTPAGIAIYNTDGGAKMRCIVVSDILGIIRTGNYTGSNPPQASTIVNNCQASPLPD